MPSTKGISSALSKDLGGPADSAGEEAGVRISSGIKKAIIAAGIGAAITKGIGAAINEGAALEQSIGGIETLYKSSAALVKQYADEAYRTAGVSANQYMEQATSFAAALVSSLGGDTRAAAETADMAIRDMSDNANKMGTDISAIQTAYQSFARQQYMLLDNLKLGYGGTKAEMERLLADAEKITGIHYDIGSLNDVYSAIHVIQEELGITGTTAKEAEHTITGSFNAMAAAAQNFLGDLALGEDLEQSLTALATTAETFLLDNLLPALGNVLKALPEVLSTALPALAGYLPELLSMLGGLVGEVLPQIAASIAEALPSLLEGLAQGTWNFVTSMAEGVAEANMRAAQETVVDANEAIANSTWALSSAYTGSNYALIEYNNTLIAAALAASKASGELEKHQVKVETQRRVYESFSAGLGDITSAAENAEGSAAELRQAYDALRAETDELIASQEEGTAALYAHKIQINEAALAALDYKADVAELSESFPALGEALDRAGISVEQLTGYLNANELEMSEWGEAVSANINYIINDFGLLETSNGMTLRTIAANLTANIEAYRTWRQNIATLWEAAEKRGDAGSIAVVEALEGMGIEGSAVVAEAVGNMDYTFGTLAPLMESAADLAVTDTVGAIRAGEAPVSGGVTSVLDGAKNAAKSVEFTSVGYQIDTGIAAGIRSGSSLVSSAAQQIAQQALSAAKRQLDIRSPSRVFRDEVGLMITAGIALGVEDGTGALMSTMDRLGGAMVAGLGGFIDQIDEQIRRIEERENILMDTRKIDEYWAKRAGLIESWLAAEAEANESGIWTEWHRLQKQILDLDQDFADDQRKKRNQAETDELKERKKALEEWSRYYQQYVRDVEAYGKEALQSVQDYALAYQNALEDALEGIGKEYQTAFDEIARSQEDYAGRLSSLSLFEVLDADRGKVALADFAAQAERLTQYSEVLAQLSERGLDADWLEEIRSMDVHDAYDYGMALMNLSDEALQAYQEDRRAMLALSDDIASAWAGPQLDALNEETQSAVETAMASIDEEYRLGMAELFDDLTDQASAFGADMARTVADALSRTGEEIFGAGAFDGVFAELDSMGGGGQQMLMPGLLSAAQAQGLTPANLTAQLGQTLASALSGAVSNQAESAEPAIYIDGQRIGFAILPALRTAAAASPEVKMI